MGMKEEPDLPEEGNQRRREGGWRERDKLQLVQEVRTMPMEGMRAIHRRVSQEIAPFTHIKCWSEAWLSRHVPVCVCLQVLSGG